MKKVLTQIELENQNRQVVIDKTISAMDKASVGRTVADLKQSRNIIPYYVTELEERLKLYLAETLLGKAKIKPVPSKALTMVPLLVVAHFTVKTVVNYIGAKNVSAVSMYTMIAKQLEIEYNLIQIKDNRVEQYEKFIAYLKHSGYHGTRLNKITQDLIAKYHSDITTLNLNHVFMQVAQLAVYALAESQPIINGVVTPPLLHIASISEKFESGTKTKVKLMPADWFMNWLRHQTLEGNMISAYHTPLIEKPKPWTSMREGGFHTENFKNSFIKTNVDYNEFDWSKMQNTVQAVNQLQNTAWEVNQQVLDVMLYAFQNRQSWGKLPAPIEVEETPYPFPNKKRSDMSEAELAQVKEWAQHMASLHSEYHGELSRYMSLNRVLGEAQRFKHYEEIYFAYQVDFRGRVYPIAANLHPQGAKFVKPLLRFSMGKAINSESAEKYLALQGANTYGQDKLRLEEKHAWVKANEAAIIASANDPIGHEFWKDADEPWSFLAFCFEWKEYKSNPDFVSKLPIALDGSCNGLQHLSAMMLDEVGGKEVNLTNNYNKEDIYMAVKKVVDRKLSASDNPMAKRLSQFGIERSTTKRPVMIVPYAGTQSACRTYIHDDFVERGGKGFFGQDYNEALNLATDLVWESIGDVVVKGREVMTWFKRAARTSIKAQGGTDIHWSTPNGFKVVQRRVRMLESLYQTSLGENIPVRLSMRLRTETDEVDIAGHCSSVSPNFIHSLDACALQNTVLECSLANVSSMAMIHDSYGTHAADTEFLAQAIRKNFVKMYKENDVINQWLSEQPASDKYPELPTFGKLDLDEVVDSEHFFA